MYVEVVDKNFQATVEELNIDKNDKDYGSNEFLDMEGDEYNNKPATPK